MLAVLSQCIGHGKRNAKHTLIALGSATASTSSNRLRPHFGETLTAFDLATKTDYSDHRPIVVDLPLQEPPLKD